MPHCSESDGSEDTALLESNRSAVAAAGAAGFLALLLQSGMLLRGHLVALAQREEIGGCFQAVPVIPALQGAMGAAEATTGIQRASMLWENQEK